ncbi:ABC transporter ATP-binding protein [Mesorhizobium sp. L-8-10]|uniref:ABC transporter ATP-binding protein n=1 Tax=Mesorhizobium sp. L-8-10 TaxID=2744523 RepID=UPI001935D455|nr:ABC transporter ATP-binding protein [Mesorhizobium sp. L-8-10]BCH33291.1 ABC transporter ATP-binding protein [Mesorhizobium sp. L-8-10]
MMHTAAVVTRLQPARPLVQMRSLAVTYTSRRGPVVALEGVDFDLNEGEFLSILGPSGCGKSTLLKCVAGLEKPTSGEIILDGAPLAGPPDGLGVVFQRDVLLDWRTVLDNVLLVAEFQGRDVSALRSQARRTLARFGLEAFADRYPWELSGGMRQRASICRALLTDPTLLLMDEPFGALDAMTRDDLNIELARLWQETRKTVLFITHSIAEAVFLSDRIVVMSRNPGRVVEIIDVDLPRPRSLAVRETQAFSSYTTRIRQLFTKLGVLQEG